MLHGETAQEVADNLLNKDLPSPRDVSSSRYVPSALEGICLRALKKDSRDRYPSVQAMLDDLKSYQLSGTALGWGNGLSNFLVKYFAATR